MSRMSLLSLGLLPAAAAMVLGSCSPIQLEEEPQWDRRVYVNDRAANDSLPAHLLQGGVKFVLQPGKPYAFKVATARASDVLDVYSLPGGGQKAFKRIQGFHDGQFQTFPLASTLSTAEFFGARLLTGSSPAAAGEIEDVSLESEGEAAVDTLKVKLFFVQQLRNLPTESAKARFANTFFAQMNSVLSPLGVAVTGVTESVNPELEPLVFPFSDIFVPIRGERVANHASLYLVDSIAVANQGTGPQGLVLGFSPREVEDISEHPESRVVLANRATIAGLAVTAVHELGHFFGLRHTVSTRHDMLQDDDFSNIEDGFSDTRFCRLDQASLEKAAAAQGILKAGRSPRPGRRPGPYCLRIAADNACSELSCDLDNLMHPVDCGFSQLRLSPQQVSFLKRNMALYRR